jgi:hypothetical protein
MAKRREEKKRRGKKERRETWHRIFGVNNESGGG